MLLGVQDAACDIIRDVLWVIVAEHKGYGLALCHGKPCSDAFAEHAGLLHFFKHHAGAAIARILATVNHNVELKFGVLAMERYSLALLASRRLDILEDRGYVLRPRIVKRGEDLNICAGVREACT